MVGCVLLGVPSNLVSGRAGVVCQSCGQKMEPEGRWGEVGWVLVTFKIGLLMSALESFN